MKPSVEQNPSEELIRSVSPSFDLISCEYLQRTKMMVDLPCKVGEGCKMEIANHTQGLFLLRVVNQYRILCGYGVDHSIGKGECWRRPSVRVVFCRSR